MTVGNYKAEIVFWTTEKEAFLHNKLQIASESH